jgi:hypothetical protein
MRGENRELLFSLAAGTLLLIGWLGERFAGFPPALSLALYLAAYGFDGYDVTRHAVRTLRARRFDTDLLMLVAALGAAALGEFAEGALLLFLFSLAMRWKSARWTGRDPRSPRWRISRPKARSPAARASRQSCRSGRCESATWSSSGPVCASPWTAW